MGDPHVIGAADAPADWIEVDAPRSLERTLKAYRFGAHDPTTSLGRGRFLRSSWTPEGPATLQLTWSAEPAAPDRAGLDATAWGPGAEHALSRVDALTGTDDTAVQFPNGHAAVRLALDRTRTARFGASGDLYHQLLTTIIAQRITAGEAIRQWRQLVDALGPPAPGPPDVVGSLRLPPPPDGLRRCPTWWFHPLGIEASRARTLIGVARHSGKLHGWAAAGSTAVAAKLALLPGVGPWTIGSVLGPALGDADAVPVGDFHFPSTVAWAIAGEARADDARMLELLEPYRGQRGRVLRAIVAGLGKAPAFGPRRRILPMSRW